VLPAGIEEVWARLLQWERQPEWMVDAAAVRVLTGHREGPGVRVAVRTRVLGLPLLTDRLEVSGWDPPERLVVVRGRGTWHLEARGPASLLVWAEQIRVPIPLLGELALLLYRPLMRRMMGRSLSNLASALR